MNINFPLVYKNVNIVDWTAPEEFTQKMILIDQKLNKKEYRKFMRVGKCYKKKVIIDTDMNEDEEYSYIWYNIKKEKFYIQLASYYPKELWIKLSNENKPLLFKKELEKIKIQYFKQKQFLTYNDSNTEKSHDTNTYSSKLKQNETEEFYYLGLLPKLSILESNILEGDPFTQGKFIRCGTEIFNTNDTNKLSVIETKHSHSKIEAYFFEFVKINGASPCYIRIVYEGNKIPVDILGTLSLFDCRKFDEFKEDIFLKGDDIDYSILLPGLLSFDPELFIEKISDKNFLNNKPKTNKLVAIILDLFE